MESLKPEEIGMKVIELSGINIYKNTRQRKYVEHRALLCYLLREKLLMRWTFISKFFESQGKTMTHATAIYLVKNYALFKRSNKGLDEIENIFVFKSHLNYDEIDKVHYLENKSNNCEKKYIAILEKLNNPLTKQFLELSEDKKERLIMMKKSWEWKQNK
tara:strand:+ start:7401 stop:7880 length:480 start_codon:yes stop_codon:yes gene_type:complete